MVGLMTIYIDGLLFLNFFIDFLLLLTTSVILKRNVKIFNVVIGAFVGSLTILILFLKINTIQLFILKIYFGILMCLFTFGFKNLKYFLINLVTIYTVGILLGGFLYMIKMEFSYKHTGFLFFKGGNINIIVLCILAPIVLYIYIRQVRLYKTSIVNYKKVNICIGKKKINLNGYLDTGNTLCYKGKPVILTNIKNTFKNKTILVPYKVIGGSGLLECIKVTKVEVDELGIFENIYLGFSKDFNVAGADVLLNAKMKEGKL